MKAFYSDRFVLPLPAGHRFPMQKYYLLRERVLAELPEVKLDEAPVAADSELARIHVADYIERVATGALDAHEQREIGFPRGRRKWWSARGAPLEQRLLLVTPPAKMDSR